jgi:hypothetical protein
MLILMTIIGRREFSYSAPGVQVYIRLDPGLSHPSLLVVFSTSDKSHARLSLAVHEWRGTAQISNSKSSRRHPNLGNAEFMDIRTFEVNE